jgi:hypothetical protein
MLTVTVDQSPDTGKWTLHANTTDGRNLTAMFTLAVYKTEEELHKTGN